MKVIRNIFYLIICFATLFTGCAEDPKMPDNLIGATVPGIRLDSITYTAIRATVYATLESENGAPVTIKGVRWYREGEEESQTTLTVTEKNDSVFYAVLDNLQDSTQYYAHVFAENIIGKTETVATPFKTIAGIARVKTIAEPDVLRANRAVIVAEITTDGEGAILIKGITYRKASDPTYSEPIPAQSEDGKTFKTEITGLEPETEYYVKAYVENNFGYSEGEEVLIKTTHGRPVISGFKQDELTETYASFSANITDEGDAEVTARGFIYSTTREGLDTASDTIMIITGSGGGAFESQLTNLEQQKQYFITAFAENSYGTTTGEVLSFLLLSDYPTVKTNEVTIYSSGILEMSGQVVDVGRDGATLVTSGIVYSTSPNPSIENGIIWPSGVSTIVFRVNKLRGNTTYYVRAYATNSNGLTSYGEEKMITTPDIYSVISEYSGATLVEGTAGYISEQNRKKGYFIGGSTGSAVSDQLWEYDPGSNSWRKLPPVSAKRYKHATTSTKDVLLLFGGLGESGQALNSVIRYSFVDEDWETLNSSGPSARYSSASSQLTIYMYIIGGIDNSQNLLNEVWSFPIFGSLWTQKAVIPEAQHSGFSFAVNNFIYAGLGFTSTDNSTYSNRFFMYEEAPEEQGGVWTELNTMPGTKAVGGTVIDNAIYIADDSGYLHIFNTQTKEWTTCLTRIPVDNRSIHCMFGFSRNNYIYFGLGNNGNELMRYDPGWDN